MKQIILGVILAMALALTLGTPTASAVTYGDNVSGTGYNLISLTANNSIDVNATYAAYQVTTAPYCVDTDCQNVVFNTTISLTLHNDTNITFIQFALPDKGINTTDTSGTIGLYSNNTKGNLINSTGVWVNAGGYPVANFTLNGTTVHDSIFHAAANTQINLSILYRLPVTSTDSGAYVRDGAFISESWVVKNNGTRLNVTAANLSFTLDSSVFPLKKSMYNMSKNSTTLTYSYNTTNCWASTDLNSSYLVTVKYRMSTEDSGTGGAEGTEPTVPTPTPISPIVIAAVAAVIVLALGGVSFILLKKR